MYKKKDCVAFVLAGGAGSRLHSLTAATAKPAVTFGGKYKIIDFTLSNCLNSGVTTVGVLTQYRPGELAEHIGDGRGWDLARRNGGVFILPPYLDRDGGEWYAGTADAVFRNLGFVDRYRADDVLILSGDHVYKMDYARMLEEHRRRGVDATVAVIKVPLAEASRYGIVTTDDDDLVVGFEEKPANPRSDVASMGVYVFRADTLRRVLTRDSETEGSHRDFGRDILPRILAEGGRIFAYRFFGYWRDVGTVESLWEANMDLLGEDPKFDPFDVRWDVVTDGEPTPPSKFGAAASVADSMISDGARVNGTVENSVVSSRSVIGEGAVVTRSVIMEDVTVGRGARVRYAVVGRGVTVGEGARVGEDAVDPVTGKPAILLLGSGCTVPPGSTVRLPSPAAVI